MGARLCGSGIWKICACRFSRREKPSKTQAVAKAYWKRRETSENVSSAQRGLFKGEAERKRDVCRTIHERRSDVKRRRFSRREKPSTTQAVRRTGKRKRNETQRF